MVVAKRAKLDLRMGYLVIRWDDESRRIFLDEINTVIVENPACCVTGCLLAELTARKIKVIFCDEKHSPCAELLPCHGHSECAGKLRESISPLAIGYLEQTGLMNPQIPTLEGWW